MAIFTRFCSATSRNSRTRLLTLWFACASLGMTDARANTADIAADQEPVITALFPRSFRSEDCCGPTWGLSIRGSHFRKCFSVFVVTPTATFEFLPTPDVDDCGSRRALSPESPRERLARLLPPDGMTIDCAAQDSLVPLRLISPSLYQRDLICRGAIAEAFSTLVAAMLSAPPVWNDVTIGGPVYWVSDNEIRILVGPSFPLGCGQSFSASVYVSSDPGEGLGGLYLSNEARVDFTNTRVDVPQVDQGNILKAVRVGDDVRLDFPGAPAQLWRIRRATADPTMASAIPLVPDTAITSFLDTTSMGSPGHLFYRVHGVSRCTGDAGP